MVQVFGLIRECCIPTCQIADSCQFSLKTSDISIDFLLAKTWFLSVRKQIPPYCLIENISLHKTVRMDWQRKKSQLPFALAFFKNATIQYISFPNLERKLKAHTAC